MSHISLTKVKTFQIGIKNETFFTGLHTPFWVQTQNFKQEEEANLVSSGNVHQKKKKRLPILSI